MHLAHCRSETAVFIKRRMCGDKAREHGRPWSPDPLAAMPTSAEAVPVSGHAAHAGAGTIGMRVTPSPAAGAVNKALFQIKSTRFRAVASSSIAPCTAGHAAVCIRATDIGTREIALDPD